MSTAIQGKQVIYLYRIYEERSTAAGTRLAFVTEDSKSISIDSDSTPTKDGSVRTAGVPEIEKSVTTILTKEDAMLPKLKAAALDSKLIELWEANLAKPIQNQNNKFAGTYYQGYITSFEETTNAEGLAEVSMTIGVNGKGADGNVTVSTDQQDDAAYTFVDTPKAV